MIVDDRILLFKTGGFVNFLGKKKGERLQNQERIGITSPFLAQPVFGDSKIYATVQNGQIAVLANSAELKILATNNMGEDCIATPAISDGMLYIRTRTKLYCIGLTGAK